MLDAILSDNRFKTLHIEAIMSLHRLNILSQRQVVASSTQYPQDLLTMLLHRFKINGHCRFIGKIFNFEN
jgi:hypothetical protein